MTTTSTESDSMGNAEGLPVHHGVWSRYRIAVHFDHDTVEDATIGEQVRARQSPHLHQMVSKEIGKQAIELVTFLLEYQAARTPSKPIVKVAPQRTPRRIRAALRG